jgi:Tfp pilus assembly protein PilX
MRMRTTTRHRRALLRQDGFTMIFAMMVLFVSSLLVAAAFVAAKGDVKLTHTNTSGKKAYYAALAGINAYKYKLQNSPNFWDTCPRLPSWESKKSREEVSESNEEVKAQKGEKQSEEYVVQTLPAEKEQMPNASEWNSKCEKKEARRNEILQSSNTTFRIESTGYSGDEVRRLIASFSSPGFIDYVYFTDYEILDPSAQNPEPTNCEHYYEYRKEHNLISECGTIQFASEDKVNGPMHTNDAAAVCGEGSKKPTFGREGDDDKVEMGEGHYAAGGGCKNEVNMLGEYITDGPTLTPPETDSELLETADLKTKGKTIVELKPGTPNTMSITTYSGGVAKTEPSVPFPTNGVMYVENSSSGCPIKYTPFNTDYTGDENCGNVYVRGEYTESLTIAAANDVIINGNLTTTHKASGEPEGGAVLGLIATNFVRVYHPVKQGYETASVKPATEAPISGKCVTTKETTGKLLKSTEVGEITTTGLKVGAEVEGTGIEAGTTISEIKESEKKIKLSKAAKPIVKEANGKLVKSTEVTEITTTGLAAGDEVEGTGIESGTTISEVKESEKKIKLSKVAKPSKKEVSGKIEKSEIVTNITTTGLASGDEVEGTGIAAGTIITEVKESEKKIKLSKSATKSETTTLKIYGETSKLKFYGETSKLKFYVPTGYEKNSALNVCYKKEALSGYEYRESENLYIKACESTTTYTSNAFCEYEITSSRCSSKATNLDSSEDPRGWGSLSNLEVDAAILSTHHSFIVDNYLCGAHLGELKIWGSIAQFWRGPVGTSGGTGYTKNYTYDERLASTTPPEFIAPTTTAWKSGRITAAPPGFEA